jgi:hypothetical protein
VTVAVDVEPWPRSWKQGGFGVAPVWPRNDSDTLWPTVGHSGMILKHEFFPTYPYYNGCSMSVCFLPLFYERVFRWVLHIAFRSHSEELVEELIYAKQLAGEDLWRRPPWNSGSKGAKGSIWI